MNLEMTADEQKLLVELIEGEQKQLFQEIDHTDRRDYKTMLKERLSTLEALQSKLQNLAA